MIPGLFQAGTGLFQAIKGRKGLKNLERPQYEIPAEAEAELAMAASNYLSGQMPGEGRAADRLDVAAANAGAMAADSGNALGMSSAIQANESAGINDLSDHVAQYSMEMGQRYQQALGMMAGYRDRQWQINKFAPYAEKANEYREMIGAGQTNIMNGLGSLSSIGVSALSAGRSGSNAADPFGQSPAPTQSPAPASGGTTGFERSLLGMMSNAIQQGADFYNKNGIPPELTRIGNLNLGSPIDQMLAKLAYLKNRPQ